MNGDSEKPPPSPEDRAAPPPLRVVDFCAIAVAVFAVEYVAAREMHRLRIVDPASVQAVKATLVVRAAQLLAMFVPLAAIRGVRPAALGVRLGDWRRGLAWAAGVSVALLAGFGGAAFAVWLASGKNLVLEAFGRSPLALAPAMGDRAIVLAGMVVVGPVAEEVFFRGGLYAILRRSLSVVQALLVTSLLFAAAHGGLRYPVLPFIGGIAFGLLFEKTGALFAPVLVHAAGNLAILLLPILFS